jgi:hypothetical protein
MSSRRRRKVHTRRANPPRRPKRSARVLDPEHKKLLAILARHFGSDDRKGRKGRGQVTTTTTTSNTKRTTRKANPREYFKIWVRIRGRTWFWYTGEDFSAAFKKPRLYLTARQGMTVARQLRRKFPTLRRRTIVVSTKRPALDL